MLPKPPSILHKSLTLCCNLTRGLANTTTVLYRYPLTKDSHVFLDKFLSLVSGSPSFLHASFLQHSAASHRPLGWSNRTGLHTARAVLVPNSQTRMGCTDFSKGMPRAPRGMHGHGKFTVTLRGLPDDRQEAGSWSPYWSSRADSLHTGGSYLYGRMTWHGLGGEANFQAFNTDCVATLVSSHLLTWSFFRLSKGYER